MPRTTRTTSTAVGSHKGKNKGKLEEQFSLLLRAIQELQLTTSTKPSPGVRDNPKIVMRPIRTYSIKQNYFLANIAASSSVSTFGAFSFNLASLANATSFEALFDAWRILQVTVRFVPLSTSTNTSVGNSPLLTVIDYDDATALTSTSSMRAYDNMYEAPFQVYLERTFKPKFAVASYSGTFTSFSQSDGWCDVASPSIQWYGLKYGIDTIAVTATASYSVEADVVYQFKSVR